MWALCTAGQRKNNDRGRRGGSQDLVFFWRFDLGKSAGGAGGSWVWIYKRASLKAVESNPASFGISQSPETLLAKLLKNAACCGFRLRPSLAANPQGRSQCIWKLCRNHWRFVPPPNYWFWMQGSSDSLAIRDSSVCGVAASETIATLERTC